MYDVELKNVRCGIGSFVVCFGWVGVDVVF